MLQGGEDPLYIARRLVRAASEDIGLADNTALPLVKNKKIFVWAGGDAGSDVFVPLRLSVLIKLVSVLVCPNATLS